MGPIGLPPRTRPAGAAWLLLTIPLSAVHGVLVAPMWLITSLLGWSRVDWILLELLSFPGLVLRQLARPFGARGRSWGLAANAMAHTHLVCRLCPSARRRLRDPSGGPACAWNRQWNHGHFGVVPDFGFRNWISQVRGRTDLSDYQHLVQLPSTRPDHAVVRPRPFAALLVASAALDAALVWAAVTALS